MNPMRQTVGAAEVKAAEVNKHDRRTMAWLELCVAADLAPSRRLLGLTAQMEGLPSIESEPTLSYTKTLSDDERDAVTTRFQAWANDGLVSRESFLVVAADVEGDLPAETWEAIKRIEKPLVEAWTTASTRVLHAPGEEPPVDDAAPEADEEPAEVDNDTEE